MRVGQHISQDAFQEESVERHTPNVDQHHMDEHEPDMDKHATKKIIPIGKKVKYRKPYVPKHLRREANKADHLMDFIRE